MGQGTPDPPNLLEGVNSFMRWAAVITGPLALLVQAHSLVYLDTRRWIWILLFAVCVGLVVATFRKFPSLSLAAAVHPKAASRRLGLIGLALVFLVLWLADEAIGHFGLILPADVRFVDFTSDVGQYASKKPRTVEAEFEDCIEWVDVPQEQWGAFVRNRRQLAEMADGRDFAQSLTKSVAATFYGASLHEGATFDIRKRPNCRQLILDDVDVIVERYVSYIGVAAAGPGANNIDIICVEIKKLDCDELPWHFGAKFLLDDPTQQSVKRWAQVQYSIADDLQRRLKIKIQARDRGIYTYRLDLLLSTSNGSHVFRVPLVKEPRVCVFEGFRQDDPKGEAAMQALGEAEGVQGPAPPAPAAPSYIPSLPAPKPPAVPDDAPLVPAPDAPASTAPTAGDVEIPQPVPGPTAPKARVRRKNAPLEPTPNAPLAPAATAPSA